MLISSMTSRSSVRSNWDFVPGKTPLVVDPPRSPGKVQPQRQLKKRSNDHPLGAFFLNLAQECGFACAGPACEKNILACVAHVFECKIQLGIGNEAHLVSFAPIASRLVLCVSCLGQPEAPTFASRVAPLF